MSENTNYLHNVDDKVSSGAEDQPVNPRFPMKFKFTPEELKALEECNAESFYQRSVPLSAVLAVGAYYGVQRGYLKPNARFGATPKILLGVFIGYTLGKLSYRNKCAEKLMAIPDSQIGLMLRQKGFPQGMGRSVKSSIFEVNPDDVYSDAGPGSSLDFDTDRPSFSTLPEFDRNAETNVDDQPQTQINPSPSMTYDELRKKNRDDLSSPQTNPYKMDKQPPPVRSRANPSSPKNKYGDAMEE